MDNIEQNDKRPSCGWPIEESVPGAPGHKVTKPCGSEAEIFKVKGRGLHTGRPRESDVCKKHLSDAWRKWNVDSADPICLPTRRGAE